MASGRISLYGIERAKIKETPNDESVLLFRNWRGYNSFSKCKRMVLTGKLKHSHSHEVSKMETTSSGKMFIEGFYATALRALCRVGAEPPQVEAESSGDPMEGMTFSTSRSAIQSKWPSDWRAVGVS